jgi:hypothetical protein
MVYNNIYFIGVSNEEYQTFISNNTFLIHELHNFQNSYPSPFIYQHQEYYIPYRIGYTSNKIISSNQKQDILKQCILTRHHNGFVREKAVLELRNLCNYECPIFVYPYIVRLLGEYVKEIWDIIYDNRSIFWSKEISLFVKENYIFMKTNRERSITYWSEYYRNDYLNFNQTAPHQYFKWVEMLI